MGERAGRVERWTEAQPRTFDETRSLVDAAISKAVGAGQNVYAWIRDMTAEWAVYELSGTGVDGGPEMYKVTYSIDDKDVVTLSEPSKVDTEYVPATEAKQAADRIEGRVLEAKGQDDAGGRIFKVQILAYGESKNHRRYPKRVMESAASKYEGAKAYDHHRTDDELQSSTITGLVGSYRNVQAGASGLEGDLHLLPSASHTAEALDASLAAQAAGLPPLVGISHDVLARYRTDQVAAGSRVKEAVEILSVNSADVVADPAAGGQAIRMVAGGLPDDDETQEGAMKLKQLLELLRAATAEKRAELLTEHASVLTDNGLTTEQVTALITEPAAPAEGEPAGGEGAGAVEPKVEEPAGELVGVGAATEATYAKESLGGRNIVELAMKAKKVDERLIESVLGVLPERFTEGEVVRHVEGLQNLQAELERAGLAPTVPHVQVGKEERDKLVERLDATFAGDAGGFRSFKEAYMAFTGDVPKYLDSEDFNRKVLRESLGGQPYDSAVRSTESVDTTSWDQILGDSITRRMVAEYSRPNLSVWRKLVSSMPPINDFRTQRITRMGGYGTLPAVAQGAPYQPLTTPGDEEATYAITKRGGTEDLTLEAIANDDLRAVQRIPRALGLAAAQTLYRFVFDFLATNPNVSYEAVALFAAGHANTDAASALAQSTLSTGRRKMRKQSAFGDTADILSIVPKLLVVPSDLEELAFQLATSPGALGVGAGTTAGANITNIPNIHQGIEPLVVDYWSDTNDWFLVADPTMQPTIEIGFYQGRQDPELFVQNDPVVGSVFTADKITWKIRHIYSGAILDHRGFYRGQG